MDCQDRFKTKFWSRTARCEFPRQSSLHSIMRITRSIVILFGGCALAAASSQQPLRSSDKHPKPEPPPYEKPLQFDNPRTDCKYVSQPWITSIFKNIATDFSEVFKYVAPDVTFRIMGHHPFAGVYDNPKIAYINSLHRLNNCLKDNEVDSKLWAIHGGCDSEWTVMELYFNATTNRGTTSFIGSSFLLQE